MSEVYAITDLKGYAEEMRTCAAKSICEDHNEDLNQYISIDQMINLVNEYCLGFDELNRPMLNEDINCQIFEQTSVWIHNVGLARLAAKDLVQCAWSDEDNTMIFWTDKAENKNESNTKKRNKTNKRKN
jgi:hypothetical protein